MRLGAARIFVRDALEAKRFYEDKIGLCVEGYNPEGGYCAFDTGPTKFIVERVTAGTAIEDRRLVGRFTGLSFPVEDIKATQERLTSLGVEFTGPPEEQPWGGWLTTFKDPDGNQLQLVQYSV